MIKNIGKIAVLHLGLILAIGAATTVEASSLKYEFKPNKFSNQSNLSNVSQSAINNNNNNTKDLLKLSTNNSSQFNSSNSNPSKTTTIGGNNYQFPTKAPFTPQTSAVLNNNTTQPKSNDMQSTNSQKIFNHFYQKKDTPKTDIPDVTSKIPLSTSAIMMYDNKPLSFITDTTNQANYSQPTTTNLFSNNNAPNTLLQPSPSSFGGQGQSTNNISQQTKMYTNVFSGTGFTGGPTFSNSFSSPQMGTTTTNQNNITGSPSIVVGAQGIKDQNTKKLSECKRLLQDIINDYIALEQYEKTSKDSLMSRDYSQNKQFSNSFGVSTGN